MKFIDIVYKLKRSQIIRYLTYPYIYIAQKYASSKYKKSKNSEYIRGLKNTHVGEMCFVLGNGPSLNAYDLSLIEGKFSFASNRIYTIFNRTNWRPNVFMCFDPQIRNMERENIIALKCPIKIVGRRVERLEYPKGSNVHIGLLDGFKVNRNKTGLEPLKVECDKHFTESETIVSQMIELAIYMGFKKIVLLGVDHTFPVEIDKDGKISRRNVKWHFEGADNGIGITFPVARKEIINNCFMACKCYADDNDIEIINATRGGRLDIFKRESLEDVLRVKCTI